LVNLEGFGNLSNIAGGLNITSNASLTSIESLRNVSFASVEFLYVGDNPLLTSLEGLNGLTSVGQILEINSNAALINLNGLSDLTIVGKELNVTNNASLINLCGLQNLMNQGFSGEYIVEGNTYNPTKEELIDGNCSQ
jgi:hypothetical protein